MSKINLKGVVKDDGLVLVAPGDYVLNFKKIEYIEGKPGKSPYIQITLVDKTGDVGTKQPFYVSDKTQENTLINLRHLITKVEGVTDAAFDAIEADDFNELAQKLDKLVANKPVHILLTGEPYQGQMKSKIGFRPFAESAKDPKNFKLKFDPTIHIKKEEVVNLLNTGNAPIETPNTNLPPVDDLSFKD